MDEVTQAIYNIKRETKLIEAILIGMESHLIDLKNSGVSNEDIEMFQSSLEGEYRIVDMCLVRARSLNK